MFKIFDRNHKQIDILENPYNAIITDELNGIGELKFTVPITYKKLQLEGYVQVKDGHEYVIKEITTEGRERNVHCVLNIEELLGLVHTTFTSKENNLNDTMKIILNGTTWTHVNNSTRTYTRNLYGTVVSSYHMLQLMSTVFDVEFYFDTHKKIVYIVDRVGEDNGTYFINDLNLKQLSQDTHTHNLITRVIPLGKDNLNISEVNGGKMWLENHTYSNKIIYGVWQVTDYDNATKLKEDAQRYLNEMAIPYESYEIQVTDISKLANNPDFRYELGDVITIIDNLTETRIKQRIYRKVYNLQDPDSDIINIASKDKSFEDYYKRMQTVADMTDKVINTDGTINSEAIDKVPADKIVGDILATGIKADSITADHIKAEQIQSKHITAEAISANHIKANSIQATHLQANSVTSEHIQADTITTAHIQTGAITAGSGIIADGAIGNAQISNLDASKLTAGTIDTSDITIAGANQNLRITGNRLQVFEGVGSSQKERVSLGDVNADGSVYGIRVRGKDGKTVLFDDNGVTKEGITDGSITNDKINPSANIDASKININSVINRINSDGSTNIQGNRISIDNKSLSSVISEINTKNTAQDSTIASQASSITANTNAIKLKVDTQTYTTDKANMTSTMNKNTSDITAMKGQIALKVEQTDINNAVNSLNNTIDSKINSAKSEIKATTDSITNRVSSTETKVTNVTNSLNNLQIGGRNLLKTSNNIYLLSSDYGDTTTRENGKITVVKSGKFNAHTWVQGNLSTPLRDLTNIKGKKFTMSVDIKTTNLNTDNVKVAFDFRGGSSTMTIANYYLKPSNNGLWHRVSATFETAGTNYPQCLFNISQSDTSLNCTGLVIEYKNWKLEEGSKATDWTPAPEDIEGKVTGLTTRVETAESKLTKNSLTTTIGNYYTTPSDVNNSITSKGYATTSQVQQKVDSLDIKFQQSGGYNLLYNGDLKNKFTHWTLTNPGNLSLETGLSCPTGRGVAVYSKIGQTSHISQPVDLDKNASTYTCSCYMYCSEGNDGTTNPYYSLYGEVYYTDGTIDYYGVSVSTLGVWQKVHFTFKRPSNKTFSKIYIFGYVRDTAKDVYFSQFMLEKGGVPSEWSPNPNEMFDGITTINKDGITVKNTSANTYTQIDTGSFSVNNNNGATIAEFSQNSNIPILTAGNITANTVKANNLATSSGNKSWSGRTYYVQGTTGVDAEGRGTSWGNAFRSVQYVLDNYIEDILNDNVSIHVGASVQGWNCYGRSGRGTLQFYLENDAVVSTEVVIQGCTNYVRVVGTNDRKGTLKKGIVAHNCSFVDIGWVTFRGENWWHASGSCNVLFSDFTRGIVRMCDLNGVSYGVIADLGSHMWLYNNKGSNVTNYVGIGAYTRISLARYGSDICPDYSGYMYGNSNHANLYTVEDGATFTKTPSVGWSPSYTPTQRTSTWNFNKIWSDETLHGWSDRNELIQGYSSAYDTGRWTGYLQMTDGMSAIRNTISGGTNLSGRVYVQRRTSSGAGTGTCCMYASDGTHIANISMARGAGAWFTLNSSIVTKIMNGSITYFYLKNDSNNINTYMKMETLGKIEITYTK